MTLLLSSYQHSSTTDADNIGKKKHSPHHDFLHASNLPLLTCALLAALSSGGPVYAFGLYGDELKAHLHLTQSQLDTISSANFCAGLLSWIPGILVDQWGTRRAIMVGGWLGALWMMLYWMVARQVFVLATPLILPTLCGLGFLIFMTNGLVMGSIFKLIVSTCAPHTKGTVVGAAKGYVGLGSGVYACLFRALKSPSTSNLDFLPLAAILAVIAGSLPAWLLLPSKEKMQQLLQVPVHQLDQTTALHLRIVYGGLVMLASMVVGTTLQTLWRDPYNHHHSNHTAADEDEANFEKLVLAPHYAKAIFILIAWMAPILSLLLLPTKYDFLHSSREGGAGNYGDDYEEIRDIVAHVVLEEEEEHEASHSQSNDDLEGANIELELEMEDDDQFEFKPLVKSFSDAALAYGAEITESVQVHGPRGMLGETAVPGQRVPNLNLMQMLQTWPAWLFVWIAIIRVGSGTMVTNNMAQMVESLALPMQTTTPAGLALFSVAQAVSRVVTGAVSDWALSWKLHREFTRFDIKFELDGIPRPAFLMVASLAGALAHLFMSMTTTRNFFLVGVCFAGAAFGMIWPLMVLIVGEVFGTAHMGANYMFFDGGSAALGTLLLSKYVTQEVYEMHIDHSELEGEEKQTTCFGQECFFETHIIITVLSFSCVIASYWFYQSTKHVYANRLI